MVMLVLFLGLMLVFCLCDFLSWIDNMPTMSQYICTKVRESKAWFWSVVGILILVPLILLWHFDIFLLWFTKAR